MAVATEDLRLNDFRHWFPLLRDFGVSVPRSEVIPVDLHVEEWQSLSRLLEHEDVPGIDGLCLKVLRAIDSMRHRTGNSGVFLRTGLVCNSALWWNSCSCVGVQSVDDVKRHVRRLVERSLSVPGVVLPYDCFIVQEYLNPKMCFGVLSNGFPIAQTFRARVDCGVILNIENFWTEELLREAMVRSETWPNPADSAQEFYGKLSHVWFSEVFPIVRMIERAAAALSSSGVEGGDREWIIDVMSVSFEKPSEKPEIYVTKCQLADCVDY